MPLSGMLSASIVCIVEHIVIPNFVLRQVENDLLPLQRFIRSCRNDRLKRPARTNSRQDTPLEKSPILQSKKRKACVAEEMLSFLYGLAIPSISDYSF